MSTWNVDGIYHWLTWADNEEDYDYAVRIACNNYQEISGESKSATFNMFNSLPNVNAPSGYEKFAVLNGAISSTTSGAYAYNLGGPTTTYSYQVKQVVWGGTPRDYDYLVMYSEGNANMNFKTVNAGANADMAPVVLGCSAKANGVGEAGVSTKRSHAFIGTGTLNGHKINYLGYTTGEDGGESAGAYGSEIVTKMTGLYGGTCALLDGGGSTQMWYNGSVERYSTDSAGYRKLQNAVVLYRKRKASKYTITVVASPEEGGTTTGSGQYDENEEVAISCSANDGYEFVKWDDGVTTQSRTITVQGSLTYTAIFKKLPHEDNEDSGTVHGKFFMKSSTGQAIIKSLSVVPSEIKKICIKIDGTLTDVVKRYIVNFNSNGGEEVNDLGYFYGNGTSLPTTTHEDYEDLPVTFNNWYKDSLLTDPITSIGTEASGDRSLYAKWTQSRTVYKGNYTVDYGVSGTQPLTDSGYSGTIPIYLYVCDANTISYEHDVTITHIYADIDECDAETSASSYKKPETWYGYYTTPGNYKTFRALAKGSDIGSIVDKDVNFILPAGSAIGFRTTRIDDGVTRTKLYFNNGSYTYSGVVKKSSEWQTSPDAPEGTWDEGYPISKNETRYYNGENWTDWE